MPWLRILHSNHQNTSRSFKIHQKHKVLIKRYKQASRNAKTYSTTVFVHWLRGVIVQASIETI